MQTSNGFTGKHRAEQRLEDLLLRSSPRGNRNDSAQTWRAERDREILAAAVMSHLGRRCCWCWWWWRLSKCLLSDTSSLCRLSVFCIVVFCFGLCFFFPFVLLFCKPTGCLLAPPTRTLSAQSVQPSATLHTCSALAIKAICSSSAHHCTSFCHHSIIHYQLHCALDLLLHPSALILSLWC